MKDPDDILFICSSHHDTDEKFSCLIKNLKTLKNNNLDICLATHCKRNLNSICDYVDYLVYDENNDFVSRQDILDNLEFGEAHTTRCGVYSHYFGGLQFSNLLCSSQTFVALLNLKNAVTLAINKGYKWVVLLEYDMNLTDIDFKSFFKKRKEVVENEGMRGYAYYDSRDWLSPYFAFLDVDLFKDDAKFMSSWSKNKTSFIQTYGNQIYENILLDLLPKEKVIIKNLSCISQDFFYDKEVFDAGDLSNFDFNGDVLNTISSNYSFFCYAQEKDNGSYDLKYAIHCKQRLLGQKIVYLNFYKGDQLEKTVRLDPADNSYFQDNVLENLPPDVDSNFKFEIVVHFSCFDEQRASYNFNLKYINIFSKVCCFGEAK